MSAGLYDGKNLSLLCPCLEILYEADLKGGGHEETHHSGSICGIYWIILATFTLRSRERSTVKRFRKFTL
jgi:hypothetical protein